MFGKKNSITSHRQVMITQHKIIELLEKLHVCINESSPIPLENWWKALKELNSSSCNFFINYFPPPPPKKNPVKPSKPGTPKV